MSTSVARTKKRDEELGRVARMKAASLGIGHPLFLARERIERKATLDVFVGSGIGYEPETLHLLWTSAENSLGARKNGRVLVASSDEAHYLYGAAFWIEEYGKRCVQSIWVEPEYRGDARHLRTKEPIVVRADTRAPLKLADLLAQMLRDAGVRCTLRPVSKAGELWSRKQGFLLR